MPSSGFCSKCGKPLPQDAAFCASCGAARGIGTGTVDSAVERDAKVRLKREHDKLVVRLGLGGGIVTLVVCVVLLAIADAMGRMVGGAFVGLIAIAAAAGFVASFVPRYAETLRRWFARARTIDPATGRPLQMLWFFRWFAAVLAVLMLGSIGDYVAAPSHSRPAQTVAAQTATAIDAGADSMQKPLSSLERSAGIAAICVTTAQYLATPGAGKDPLIVAANRAREFVPSDPRMGWVVSHLLVSLYRRGPSKARLKKLNAMAREFNNPKGLTPLTESSWSEDECEASEGQLGVTPQVVPPGSVGQVFASETQ